MIGVRLIDKGFKVVQCDASKVGYGKKNLLSIIVKLFITCTKINLTLEYKYTKFIWTAPAEGVRLLDNSELLLRTAIRLLGNSE